uniref:Uncharacterized protein n=1 Tax=Glossina pallidipes TaxID=7398 RepID=A0A1A9ZPE8_GLOPL
MESCWWSIGFYADLYLITSTSQCLTDMAEGCEEAESNSNNRNADNAPTMLGTVLPCEAAITASLGVSGGGVMKREFVDAASSILGSSLAAAAHLTASCGGGRLAAWYLTAFTNCFDFNGPKHTNRPQ